MVEGSASLMGMFYELHGAGRWGARGENFLDGAAPFYNPYRCADGKWISIGAIEPQFYALLVNKVGWQDRVDLKAQNERGEWPQMKEKWAALFAQKTRDEWCALLEGTDACFAPILDFDEAARHPHNVARGSFVEVDGQWLPGPAPRFSATPGAFGATPATIGQDLEEVLADWCGR
ncbi:MAG: CoA transferase, partial [Janthinobacterium lividum]